MDRTSLITLASLTAAMAATIGSGAALGGVADPYVTTDRSVDTRSAKTIVRSLTAGEMTDEEKALAIFHWVRRVLFHSGKGSHDFNKMINVYGYGHYTGAVTSGVGEQPADAPDAKDKGDSETKACRGRDSGSENTRRHLRFSKVASRFSQARLSCRSIRQDPCRAQ